MIQWPTDTLNNKYKRWYELVVLRAQTRVLPSGSYKESHHIIPQSIGGSNKKINLVNLTAREHFICHRMLTKFLVGESKMKMSFAMFMMVTNRNKHQLKRHTVTSRLYEIIKKEMAIAQSMPEHRAKISRACKGRVAPNKGIPMSNEQKEKLRQINLGKTVSEETKKKISAKQKGSTRNITPEWRANMNLAGLKKGQGWNKGKKMPPEFGAKISALMTPERREIIRQARLGIKASPETLINIRAAQARRRAREAEEKQKLIANTIFDKLFQIED
jgi:hypothetical protein